MTSDRCARRRVFIWMKAPLQGLARSAICCIVRRALRRAGLNPTSKGLTCCGTPATDLLRRGASLGEIGQLLRHRQPTTTQIYAKVDIAALRGIALPWPGVRQRASYKPHSMSICGTSRPRLQATPPAACCSVRRLRRSSGLRTSPELALAWATQPTAAQPAQWANRLGMVRRVALYCSASDPRTTVPPQDLLPHRYHRPDPYLYRDEEIMRLLEAARRLPPATGLRPHTFATLFGLYVATGLRANEPLRLDRDDVDLVNGVLTIRDTKFGKSRYVPLHASTQRALQRYAARRDRSCRELQTPSFFVSDRGPG